ncbi:MAG: HAMP domain-containing protein, partial [Proteobacteria bacterium]|nr:HAMP domain-containing protein [Pseudomonadota bacterium]
LYVAIPIKKDGKVSGILRASLFLKDINNLLNKLKTNIVYIAMIIVAISLLGALIFSRNLSKPIRELSHASRKVAQGDFNVRVFLKNNDWIATLEAVVSAYKNIIFYKFY